MALFFFFLLPFFVIATMALNNDDTGGDEDIWEGLEDLVTLPNDDQEESVPIAPGFHNFDQNQEPINWFWFGNEEQKEEDTYWQLQFEEHLHNQEIFIHRQERLLGSLAAGSGYDMKLTYGESTSDLKPSEIKSKKQGRAEKKKQSDASTSKTKGKGKKLSPEEQWANSLFNEDEYGRIKVEVEVLRRNGIPRLKFTVKVHSEFSTVAQIKEAIASYVLTVFGDEIPVERITIPMVNSAGQATEMEFPDHLTLRDINTQEVKLIVNTE